MGGRRHGKRRERKYASSFDGIPPKGVTYPTEVGPAMLTKPRAVAPPDKDR